MNIVPLRTDPDDDSWDTEDYSLVEKELLPVKIFEGTYRTTYGGKEKVHPAWFWRIDHPAMAGSVPVGPFPSGRAAFRHMKQFKNSTAPAEIPSEVPGMVAMGALDATAEKLVMNMLDSPDPNERAKARELIEKHSYD